MPTATPMRMTRPRLALMILEATAATVSVVLLLWLLLWFIHRTVPQGSVEAYFVAAEGVPPEEVPYQAADVRRFREARESEPIRETTSSEWPDAVLAKAREGGSTLVVYVSAPVLARDTEAATAPIAKLVRDVAREARRDVVLALDLAQVDSDRELGLFGSSPYARLMDEIRKAVKEQGEPGRSVFLLTSAAPAQRSWSADGLGQSIFAYYLRRGLEGGARGWDAAEPGSITVSGLHRYILQQVRRWAGLRRGSEQTPQLLPVLTEGQKPRTVFLRPLHPGAAPSPSPPATAAIPADAAPPPAPEGKEKAGPAGKAEKGEERPAEPTPDPLTALWDDLFKEWRKHEEIRATRPYRDLPGAWRSYDASLLRAERGLRAARRDPVLWTQRARDVLASAREKRDRLEQDLKSRAQARHRFPFRAIGDDPADARQLVDALAGLKIEHRPRWLEAAVARSDEPPTAPGKEPTKTGAAPDGSTAPPPIPRAFSVPVDQIQFLELQLPAWAYRFQAEFRCPAYFREPGRSQRLVRMIDLRHEAETAIAADRRGLGWIRPLIEIGDRERRSIQDRLFGRRRDGDLADEEARLTGAKSAYDAARAAIDQYRAARETWEQAADRFPYHAEWAIRREAIPGRAAPGLPANPVPEGVSAALRELDGLARALAPPTFRSTPGDDEATVTAVEEQARKLSDAAARARDAVRALEDDFRRTTDSYVTGGAPGWVELDAALRVPLIEPARREALLKALLALGEAVDDIGSTDGEDRGTDASGSPDRGFWVRAAGMARLDLGLRRLGRLDAREAPEEDAAIKGLWEAVRRRPEEADAASAAFPVFDAINTIDAGLRGEARGRLLAATPDDHEREMADAEKDLRGRDVESRLLTATEADALLSGADGPARDYDRLAECACLEFHLGRLQQDYADDRSLRAVAGKVDDLKAALGIKRTPGPAPGGGLAVAVTPEGPRAIDEKDWKTEFKITVATPPGVPRDQRPVPPGDAFVGLVGAADGLTANDQPLADVPGGLVRLPVELTAQRTVPFTIVQKDKVPLPGDSDTVPLVGQLFYRGRSDLAAAVTIAVRPRKIDERVAIRILQDTEKLKTKYPNVDRPIPDQFRSHPGEGFLHKGKDIDYVIEVQNRTPRRMTVTCRHYLVDDTTQQKTETRPAVERQVLEPGVPVRIFWGKVKASDAPNGRPHLRVELTDVQGQGEIPPFNVTFKEITWQSYITIRKRYDDNYSYEVDGARRTGPCFLVGMRRDENDPVTEPIPADQLGCEFSAENLSPTPLTGAGRGKPWIWPGDDIEFYQPTTNLKRPIKWTPQIEGERLETRVEP